MKDLLDILLFLAKQLNDLTEKNKAVLMRSNKKNHKKSYENLKSNHITSYEQHDFKDDKNRKHQDCILPL